MNRKDPKPQRETMTAPKMVVPSRIDGGEWFLITKKPPHASVMAQAMLTNPVVSLRVGLPLPFSTKYTWTRAANDGSKNGGTIDRGKKSW